jgi:hypothetical protein
MTATTEVRISIREERTANSILLPVQLNGIVSENDFREFSFTILEQIRAFDSIVARRKKFIQFESIILSSSFGFVMCFILKPAIDTEEGSVRSFVLTSFNTCLAMGLLFVFYTLLDSMLLLPKRQSLVDEQNEIYRNANATCVDMSQRVQASLTSSSPVASFTTLLGMRAFKDGMGRYLKFEYIEFKMTTEGHESDNNNNNHNNDEDQNAPDSEQVALLLNVDNNTHVLISDTA